ncbi:phosphotransferase [Brachybacterium sp. GPGPB12]|uniref:phosphotransferase family protein n=1 Tax=Brachybacterium sp. GPGPB12 TaxID=3023517 RepID=UPI00313424D7
MRSRSTSPKDPPWPPPPPPSAPSPTTTPNGGPAHRARSPPGTSAAASPSPPTCCAAGSGSSSSASRTSPSTSRRSPSRRSTRYSAGFPPDSLPHPSPSTSPRQRTRKPGRSPPASPAACRPPRTGRTVTCCAPLATSLAHLHHAGDQAGLPEPGRPDPVGAADLAHAWWRENEPEAAQVLADLWPAVRRHQERTGTAFRAVTPVLLHGDPAAANLLVDDDGTVRFVDWEWAQRGDPARDLAFIGGPITAEPWYAALDDDLLRDQTAHYLAERSRRSGEPSEPVGPVLERRRAHLVHEVFFTAAHLHRTGEEERRAALLAQVADVVR